MTARLDVRGVAVGFGGHEVLRNVSFSCSGGDLVAITGPSGVGKTTLLMAVAGLLEPGSGSCVISQEPVAAKPARRARAGGSDQERASSPRLSSAGGPDIDLTAELPEPVPDEPPIAELVPSATLRVAYVPQSLGLAPWLTAGENVALPLQLLGLPRDTVKRRTVAQLAAVGLDAITDRQVTELSGGQRQRVAVARALAAEPDVIVADEPTAELDAENRKLVLSLLVEASGRGALCIVATHDPEVADACSVVYRLDSGRLIAL